MLKEGYDAFAAGDDVGAYMRYRMGAELGYRTAQANLAWLYEQGVEPYVARDYDAAQRFYKLAAAQVRVAPPAAQPHSSAPVVALGIVTLQAPSGLGSFGVTILNLLIHLAVCRLLRSRGRFSAPGAVLLLTAPMPVVCREMCRRSGDSGTWCVRLGLLVGACVHAREHDSLSR